MSEHHLGMNEVLAVLRAHKQEQVSRFDVVELALFGSTAWDMEQPESDIDILVSFDGPIKIRERYFGVRFYLEDLLGRSVDLVTENAVRPELRPYADADAVRV